MSDFPQLAQQIAIWAVPVLLAITVHEAAHGFAAQRLGDDTAARAGRLSLNPLRHIDPIGTVLVPGVLLMLGGFLFGWAKPVPVRFDRLHSPRRDMILVAAAGPAVNLIMAMIWAALIAVFGLQGASTQGAALMRDMCIAGIAINLLLMVLNLIPLPPLDGGRIAVGLLPASIARQYSRLENWGLLILVALLATGVLSKILYPPLSFAEGLLYKTFGIEMIEP